MEKNAIAKINRIRQNLYSDLCEMVLNRHMKSDNGKYVLDNSICFKDKGIINSFTVKKDNTCNVIFPTIELEVSNLNGDTIGHIYPYQLPIEELGMFYDMIYYRYYAIWESQQIF